MNKIEETFPEFSLVCCVDMADVADHPGSLIKLLSDKQKDYYEPDERLVFYTSRQISDNLIKHLYETFNFVDISNFFAIIVTVDNIQSKLDNLCSQYSSDNIPFSNFVLDQTPTKIIVENFQLPDTICAIPWSNIEIEHSGKMSSCCMTTSDAKQGNILNNRIEDVFYSDKTNNLRQDLLKGKRPELCKNCWKMEDMGLSSIRTLNADRFKKDFLTTYLDNPRITSLDIKFSNVCNFKCRICSPYASSQMAVEAHKHIGLPMINHKDWEKSSKFNEQIIELLPQLQSIDMFGGEPFLIQDFTKVLQYAVDNNYSKNLRLHYNSNGSIYPENLLDIWKNFKNVNILFSIDDIGPRFELERGGSWQKVESNILRLKALNIQNLTINLMPSIGAMNVFYMDELYDWATKNNFLMFVSHVRHDRGLTIRDLTKQAQDLIIEKFKNHPWQEMQNIVQELKKTPPSDGKLFCKTMEYFDRVRNQNFAETHPEIAQAMGYTV